MGSELSRKRTGTIEKAAEGLVERRWQCFAKCPYTCQFDRLSDQLCQSLDRLSDHFAKHWQHVARIYLYT